MRLGDLDVLKAQLKKLPMMSNWGEAFIPRLIDEQPTIDAVPVVRCRDCRRFLPYTAEYKAKVEKADGDCGVLIFSCIDHQYAARQVDDFCSYGQRKEAAHD